MIIPQELLKQYPYARECLNCGANPQKPTWDDLSTKIANCNLCMLDIEARGAMSSTGMGFLANLYQKDPDNPKWEKIIEMFFSRI